MDLTTKEAVTLMKHQTYVGDLFGGFDHEQSLVMESSPRVPSMVSGVTASGKFVAFEQEASRRLQHCRIGCQGGSWTKASLAEKNATRTESICRYAGLGKELSENT